jgi:hypothetical protein
MRNKTIFWILRVVYFLWVVIPSLMFGMKYITIFYLIVFIATALLTQQYFFKDGFDKKTPSIILNVFILLLSGLFAFYYFQIMNNVQADSILILLFFVVPYTIIGLTALINCIDVIRD